MTENLSEQDIIDLNSLEMEFNLTLLVRVNCSCREYLIRRKNILLPEIFKVAREKNEEPIDLFASFARNLHELKCGDVTASRFAALMGLVMDDG